MATRRIDCMLQIFGLTKRYRERVVLNQLQLTAGSGEYIAIVGESGSGKSTLLNLIAGLDRPDAGSVVIDGTDIAALDDTARTLTRRTKLGFVFQGFNLLSRTSALENVELPMLYNGHSAMERRERAMAALKSVGLEGREDHHPNQLSGGQQQRVAIARALVNDAPIILADEPTGNLDTKTSAEIMELFVRLNREAHITVILVTHEPDIATFSKRIIRFLDGHIVSDEAVSKS